MATVMLDPEVQVPVGIGILRIPAPEAKPVQILHSPVAARDRFDPTSWHRESLRPCADREGYYEIDLDELGIEDGVYEYEFILDDRTDDLIADPYAEEITRFGGYRGLFRIVGGKRWRPFFCWDNELPAGTTLAANHELVIYQLPMRWMNKPGESIRQITLATFERVAFERLDQLADLAINAIELLPIQDSPDTLEWGYGSRFFFAPDFDMGPPADLKFLIQRCHQLGIRVFLDVVMNHARACPLEKLADDWFFLHSREEEPGRGADYAARLFRYRRRAPDGHCPAREFHYQMGEHWVREYHIDGFRIDEFRGISQWEFVQTFRDRTTQLFRRLFPNRPFLVIAEDSWRRTVITRDQVSNPNGRKVVDAMWNVAYRDEIHRLMRNDIRTLGGQPSRRERIMAMISGRQSWDELSRTFRAGFQDMAQAVNYITSHDVEEAGQARFMNACLSALLKERQLGDGSVENVRRVVDQGHERDFQAELACAAALDRVRSGFALLLTSVGIPMLLAGEEFGDVHDLDHTDWRLKMSDPVDWHRRSQPGHRSLWYRVRELIRLRTMHPALKRNEVEFPYFHPAMDQEDGVRVFCYCRTGGMRLGSRYQVQVVANCGPHHFPEFHVPWPWTDTASLHEHAAPSWGTPLVVHQHGGWAHLSLSPYQVRVFST